jgi:ABC-type nitrate/sulfonate/bicarbonate transport system permease component
MTRPKMRVIASWASELIPFLGLISVWQLSSWFLGSWRLPSPQTIVISFWESALQDPIILAQGGGAGGYLPHAISTLLHTVVACSIGVSVGMLAALGMALSRPTLWIFDSVLEIVRVLPPLILVPFAVLIFGFFQMGGLLLGEVIIIALYASLSIGIYTLSALSSLPYEYNALGKLLGAGRIRRLLTIQLPGIIPSLIGPLRIIVSLGLGIAVVIEYLSAPVGIGRVMYFAQAFYRIDLIFVGIIWAVLSVLVLDLIISLASSLLLPWTGRSSNIEDDKIG